MCTKDLLKLAVRTKHAPKSPILSRYVARFGAIHDAILRAIACYIVFYLQFFYPSMV